MKNKELENLRTKENGLAKKVNKYLDELAEVRREINNLEDGKRKKGRSQKVKH